MMMRSGFEYAKLAKISDGTESEVCLGKRFFMP